MAVNKKEIFKEEFRTIKIFILGRHSHKNGYSVLITITESQRMLLTTKLEGPCLRTQWHLAGLCLGPTVKVSTLVPKFGKSLLIPLPA